MVEPLPLTARHTAQGYLMEAFAGFAGVDPATQPLVQQAGGFAVQRPHLVHADCAHAGRHP